MTMLPGSFTIISWLTLGSSLFVSIVLLSVLAAMRKCGNNGENIGLSNVSTVESASEIVLSLLNIEEEEKFDAALVQRLAEVIAVLPSLEV
jgi:hypothetical protein